MGEYWCWDAKRLREEGGTTYAESRKEAAELFWENHCEHFGEFDSGNVSVSEAPNEEPTQTFYVLVELTPEYYAKEAD